MLNNPLLSKTTYYQVLMAEQCVYTCIWGVIGATEAGVQAVFVLLGDYTKLTFLLHAVSYAK